jgi:hypothetical protein
MRVAASTSCVTAPSPAKPRSFCKTSRVLVCTACSATHEQKHEDAAPAGARKRRLQAHFDDGLVRAARLHKRDGCCGSSS